MEYMGKLWRKDRERRRMAGLLAAVMLLSAIGVPFPVQASDIWPQKATAPFYCLDGGKGWRQADRYDTYKYDTLPSPLTEVQAKRLFWAYPTNWQALKKAAQKYDPDLYSQISSTVSGPNVVKRVKDDRGTKFAWIADNPEIEARAIAVMERASAEGIGTGKEAPQEIREATSEEAAVSFTVLPFSDGPGALDTEFVLGNEFIRDIARIEPQSVWDNGSTGGNVGWLDASQDKNIAKSVMGENLYEVTWSGDSIRIHNNGSATANENAVGSTMSEEEKYNKTTVRYKITMRANSGWYTEGSWNDDYLHQWMDFKACINSPGHQRLYKADMRIVPSDMVFYIVIQQGESDVEYSSPEYGIEEPELSFQVFRHEETFKSNYNVRLKKLDDETGMPLKGSQFYLYEKFEDGGSLGQDERDSGLSEEKLSFSPWDGFHVFAEGTTDEKGEISHTDSRSYEYSKTYCDGHSAPKWAEVKKEGDGEEDDEGDFGEDDGEEVPSEASDQVKDMNQAAAREWMDLVEACEQEAASGDGTHFHWLADEGVYDEVSGVLESGVPGKSRENGEDDEEEEEDDAVSGDAFAASGCREDCEKTYDAFINLKFTYTWKEIQARTGYILHDLHADDIPVETVTTTSSEAGAKAIRGQGSSRDITENIWHSENLTVSTRKQRILKAAAPESGLRATPSNAVILATPSNSTILASPSNAWTVFSMLFAGRSQEEEDDSDWEEREGGDFQSYLDNAETDGIRHLDSGEPNRYSHCSGEEDCKDFWIVRDHRTEGKIHINKRDLSLYKGESDGYSSYGDTEGDGTLEGAVYGLFAAEDIVHPDSDVSGCGTLTNTGIVYRKNDLVATAVTDDDGNAEFSVYTAAPGMTYYYESGKVERRTDIAWQGPENRYEENLTVNGNYWIGRPLLLGKYYIKELSRSEGYELSVNGISGELTNADAGFETPDSFAALDGMAVVSMPELAASMEGEDGSGTGYDQFPFTITSSGTKEYEILVSGLPENVEFYRVDSGEEEVTGPHVTGTEEVPVKDENGNQVWKTAESSRSNIKYLPEYDADGRITGQIPMSRTEPQVIKAEQVPQVLPMKLTNLTVDGDTSLLNEMIADYDLTDEEDTAFRFIKSETENILNRNGYEIPVMADGSCSSMDLPVYSRGVKKGQTDVYGMTAQPGNPAVKTYYGSATVEIKAENPEGRLSVQDVMEKILYWYQSNPQWSFGGIDSIRKDGEDYKITLYAGASVKGSRRFFTMTEQDGKAAVDKVYTVLENPKTLRWMYQEYEAQGEYQYQVERQYYLGSRADKRYYIDVTLTPAVLPDTDGSIQKIYHSVMVYHDAGEEIIDYLSGDEKNGYRVMLTETVDKIEITTEKEAVETDVRLPDVSYDSKRGIYRILVKAEGTDSYGKEFSDREGRLSLSFMAKLPKKQAVLLESDISSLGNGNVYGYEAGDVIGYAEYLARFGNASITVSVSAGEDAEDTYIVTKQLTYRGQTKISEDGDSKAIPVQVLERPVKQKIKVVKRILDGETIGNFRFKVYLKSNLERLYCDENGEIIWTDKYGNTVDAVSFHEAFPELVQKLYTIKTERRLLETIPDQEKKTYNYEKFFDAVHTANTDKWKCEGGILNSSFKPFASALYTGTENEINTSEAAVENAKRSDAVRQFAVTWYLKERMAAQEEEAVLYADEVYDTALYEAILKAEEYLKPFFRYDLDSLYSIEWDSEKNGGIDKDNTTLSAWQIKKEDGKAEYAFGISEYLPYGDYVLVEQQPFKAEWMDFANRHYRIDAPKEISLPAVYEDTGNDIPGRLSTFYEYGMEEGPAAVAEKFFIRFNEDWTESEKANPMYVVSGHSNEGDFKVYPYGMKIDKSEYDGRYASMLVPWTVTDDACSTFLNRLYQVTLRIEKLDSETGENILHDDSIFALYRAERNEKKDGDGAVKRYARDTVVKGSRQFLEAMGAKNITSFARAGGLYYGTVGAGTPICREEDCISFQDETGRQTGFFHALPTIYDNGEKDVFQITGYLETPEPVTAGVYVLAELKAPKGYVRSGPIPVEIYSDSVSYYPDGGMDKAGAVLYEYPNDTMEDSRETAEIYVNDTATGLEVSKKKTADSYRGMKVSGRVEGSITTLGSVYGLENLELAFNSMGTYLGFGWKKGTLEYLESRKASGERVEIVYENGVFQGYGYVTRTLETAEDENRYVAGAELALFEAIEVRPTGDREDYAFEGVEVKRDRNGNVEDIIVKQGYAGSVTELLKTDEGIWTLQEVERKDTSVLFYDLGGLKVLEQDVDHTLYGYGKDGERMKITFDTDSVYALKGGRPIFEISGGDFSKLVYDRTAKAFTSLDENTTIYHLNDEMGRDALVDGYTGLAYVEKSGLGPLGREEGHFYVWPVTALKDKNGNIFRKDKILTGRPGEVNAGTGQAYITGTWNSITEKFEKKLNPVLDMFGLVQYYLENKETYKKGEPVYDRDGDYLGYRYEDLLEDYNRASYTIQDMDKMYDVGNPEDPSDDSPIFHRNGEAWVIPNIWTSGEKMPQDPTDGGLTWGQADILRRVVPGTYIMEEIKVPPGYVRSLPVAVCVEEKKEIQRVSMTDEKIKVEILKTDGTEQYRVPVINAGADENSAAEWSVEGKGAYTNTLISGSRLALYRAERVYTSDFKQYPKGYFLVKAENTPASWETEDPVDNHPVKVTALWITDGKPKYFEGIPAGDYILEELDAPAGYLPASMEITVKAVPELQSFILKDDHTKLEIFKYEEDRNKNKLPLSWPHKAELTLYPAVLDGDGSVQIKDGSYVYEKENPVDSWTSGTFLEYGEAMTREYEAMFLEYGDTFKEFSWQAEYDEKTETRAARLLESDSTGNKETVIQLWEMEDGSGMRVTAASADGCSKTDETGRPAVTFEYQLHYKAGMNPRIRDMVSYDTQNGLHRIDRIPEGIYILVETKAPDGYQKADAQVITVNGTPGVQRYFLENKERLIYVDKTDEDGNQIPDAKLALYRADGKGSFTEDESCLVDCWISGKEGIYTADDLAGGLIPDGYAPGDMRLHKLPAIADGVYYLVERSAPDYWTVMEPQKIEINGFAPRVIRAVNHLAKGQLIIEKLDKEWYGKKLSGAWFEVKNLKTGKTIRMVTDENGMAVSAEIPTGYVGKDGTVVPYEYQVKEIQAPEGYCLNLEVWSFRFENGNQSVIMKTLEVEDEETRLWFSKSDFKTGHFVAGARLAIYNVKAADGKYVPDGEPVETWISGNSPHLVSGKLSGKRTYFLVEEEAPPGYSVSPPIMFTVSADGKKIVEITEESNVVQIEYDREQGQIKSVSVLGRAVIGGRNTIKKNGEEILNVPITGKIELPAKLEGEVLTVGEYLEFSDGNHVLTEQNTFRVSAGSADSYFKRLPVKTEYCLFNDSGHLIDNWDSEEDGVLHVIENEKGEDGNRRFEPKHSYDIVEKVLFDDGSSTVTGKTTIFIKADGSIRCTDIKDRASEVRIKKTDVTTGKELPGALLEIKDLDGKSMEQWISGEEEHVLTGVLNPGETYILSEVMAAEGFSYAEEILFTVDGNGCVNRVEMEDKPTHAEISKTDMTTGEELPGAVLSLKNQNGDMIEQWISGWEPHRIIGTLIAGETYVLSEETAPEGYLVAEEVTFTVSLDGKIDKAVMEDRRKEPEEPEIPDTPEEPDIPEKPDISKTPEKPNRNEWREPDLPKEIITENAKKPGTIKAWYDTAYKAENVLRLKQPERLSVHVPKAGDSRKPWFYGTVFFLSLAAGIVCLIFTRRKKCEK